jgi:hypothetical protein
MRRQPEMIPTTASHRAKRLSEEIQRVPSVQKVSPAKEPDTRGDKQQPANLQKLYHVPVFAVRNLLQTHLPGRKLGQLRQAELIAEVARLPNISEDEIELLYENYRYGARLSFFLYLLPSGLQQPAMEEYQAALDELVAEGEDSLGDEIIRSEDLESETLLDQINLLDEEWLGSVREIRFRYLVAHHFLNIEEQPDCVLQSRYGFLWIDLQMGYLIILARDERVNQQLTQAASQCLQAIPIPIRFSKELLNKHFSIEKAKRVSHYDPGTGVRQSISGHSLWKEYEDEILFREQRYTRPSSLYDEQVAEGLNTGLGVTSSKGKVYLTKALPASLMRAWAIQRLPDLVRDVKETRAAQPELFSRSLEEINRMRLPAAGRAAITAIVEALLRGDREDLTALQLSQSAQEIYTALDGKYFDRYLRAQCAECDETAESCPHCDGRDFQFKERQIACKECGAAVSDEHFVVLRCINGHATAVPIADAVSIAPNHWLLKRMARIFDELGLSWDAKADYFHIEGSTLYRLNKGKLDPDNLPPLVQNYISHFWDAVSGPVHTGGGDIVSDD